MVKLTQTIFLFIAFLGAAQTWAVCNFDSQGMNPYSLVIKTCYCNTRM